MAVKIYNADKTITYRGIILDVLDVPLKVLNWDLKEIPLQYPAKEDSVGKAALVLNSVCLSAYIVSKEDLKDAIISIAGDVKKNDTQEIISFKITALHIDLPKHDSKLNLNHQIQGIKNFHLKDKM